MSEQNGEVQVLDERQTAAVLALATALNGIMGAMAELEACGLDAATALASIPVEGGGSVLDQMPPMIRMLL